MGISIVQKSDLSKRRPQGKVALVLAGGAIAGGIFKVGGLKALNDFLVNRKVTDFDIYVGLSAGSFLAAPLAGGIGPEEMLKSLEGSSRTFTQLSPLDLYRPNLREFFERPISYLYRRATFVPGILYDAIQAFPKIKGDLKERALNFLSRPNYSNFEDLLGPIAKVVYSRRPMPSLAEAIPSGLLDNSGLERFIRKNMERNHLTNNFKVLKRIRRKSLYIVATVVDTAEREIFGYDEKNDVTISQAVWASTALPGVYKPVRLKGIDYIDGAVRRTANIDVAINKGAELIICYNPFRPFNNDSVIKFLHEEDHISRGRRLSDFGLFMVLNQAFRALFQTRLKYSMLHYETDPNFKGDIILIEPSSDDALTFEINPLAFWQRAKAAKLGFSSVRESIEKRYDEIAAILSVHGIELSKERVDMDYSKMTRTEDDDATLRILEEESPRRRFQVISNR